jgi:hypothetical protein
LGGISVKDVAMARAYLPMINLECFLDAEPREWPLLGAARIFSYQTKGGLNGVLLIFSLD